MTKDKALEEMFLSQQPHFDDTVWRWLPLS